MERSTHRIDGEADPRGSRASSIMTATFPDAERVTVADCGHPVHMHEPTLVIEAIDRFLERLREKR